MSIGKSDRLFRETDMKKLLFLIFHLSFLICLRQTSTVMRNLFLLFEFCLLNFQFLFNVLRPIWIGKTCATLLAEKRWREAGSTFEEGGEVLHIGEPY